MSSVDRLKALATAGSGDRFAGRLALTRLGAFGHSMGGITSAAFCARDPRCRAAINLDGSPQYGDLIDNPGKASVPDGLRRAAGPARRERRDLRPRAIRPGAPIIAGALHLNFGDFQYREGDARGSPDRLGPIAADRSTAIVHRLVREWFGHWLSGKRSKLLAGEPVFEELTVGRIGE